MARRKRRGVRSASPEARRGGAWELEERHRWQDTWRERNDVEDDEYLPERRRWPRARSASRGRDYDSVEEATLRGSGRRREASQESWSSTKERYDAIRHGSGWSQDARVRARSGESAQWLDSPDRRSSERLPPDLGRTEHDPRSSLGSRAEGRGEGRGEARASAGLAGSRGTRPESKSASPAYWKERLPEDPVSAAARGRSASVEIDRSAATGAASGGFAFTTSSRKLFGSPQRSTAPRREGRMPAMLSAAYYPFTPSEDPVDVALQDWFDQHDDTTGALLACLGGAAMLRKSARSWYFFGENHPQVNIFLDRAAGPPVRGAPLRVRELLPDMKWSRTMSLDQLCHKILRGVVRGATRALSPPDGRGAARGHMTFDLTGEEDARSEALSEGLGIYSRSVSDEM